MKKILLVTITSLFLTACGGSNTEQFLGTWVEVAQGEKIIEPTTFVITEDSGSKVNMLLDIIITKKNTTYLVEDNKLIDMRDKQTAYVLENGLITSTASKTVFKKK